MFSQRARELDKRISLATRALVDDEHKVHVNAEAIPTLAEVLEANPSPQNVWLVITILKAGYPIGVEVSEGINLLRIMGGVHFIESTIGSIKHIEPVQMELLRDAVLVDVYHTAGTELATGIQRVVRETARRWKRDHELTLVTWTLDQKSLRRLTPAEEQTALWGAKPASFTSTAQASIMLVPVGGYYIMPELGAEHWRTARIAAMAEFAGLRSGAIGHDCVPLTTAETTGAGMPAGFARYLAALTRMDAVSVTSVASEAEYLGWRKMLEGIGYSGPNINLHALASSVLETTVEEGAAFEGKHRKTKAPLVVVVGSHEPRKNHLAVLRAADELWREGLEFELLFIGGNSWNNKAFKAKLQLLLDQGRNVNTASAITDADLYSAYRRAIYTVYPSINEGFGLPVAESLLLGTPVITSNFGSMADLGKGKGAILIDPRSTADLPTAMRTLLTNEKELNRLKLETKKFVGKSWDDYASETWNYFTQG